MLSDSVVSGVIGFRVALAKKKTMETNARILGIPSISFQCKLFSQRAEISL